MRGGNVVEIRETPAWRHAAYADIVIQQAQNADEDLFRERLDRWSPGKRVLEFGCGAGGLAIPLARNGYTVTGVDANPLVLDALRKAVREQDLPIQCIDGLIEETTDLGQFDAVVIASVLINAGDAVYRAGLFESAARHLSENGILIFEHCDSHFFSEVGDLREEQQELVCKGRSESRWIGEIRYNFDDRTVVVPAVYHLADDAGLREELSRHGFAPLGESLCLNIACRLSHYKRTSHDSVS